MSSERKATFTKGRTVYIYVGVIYWRLAVVISVWLCKSKASLWGESTCHCSRCTLWRQQWRHQNGNTTAETILNAWEQSKDSFFTCILFLYRHISTEITPFQLAEMSQGKPTCGDFFSFKSTYFSSYWFTVTNVECKHISSPAVNSMTVDQISSKR